MVSARTLIFACVAAALLPGMSLAQDAVNQGYLVDSNKSIVTSSTTGLCVRDSDWTPEREAACNPEPVKKAVVPVPRAAIVTPPPPRVAPPAKVLLQKINFSADALFAFNKFELKPAGRAMLDDLVRTLNGAQYDAVFLTGHTDRFGTTAYNQRLSERRAHAVRDYLVSRNIPANRINATGKGETQPVTKAGDCPRRRSAKAIACLQPDRRVDVEVHGTRGPATSSR
jgi:OOP family OmpA-OmpF porin